MGGFGFVDLMGLQILPLSDSYRMRELIIKRKIFGR